ncbi:hypothetical protein [Amphritea pacifica]|uniref:DUF1269 domain-containing protein n=1 Tax=Amphritea pacifica TaxID=2811233 RepID=A0ABS2WCD6_9GAMM|nr:hypothetical protein [Amphritea pacifica]MBN0989276.1 hypothetical protein [Amphritea pacifica]MBN1007296.1 hypothetical protein [Amphritea pacifica]
MRRLTFLTPDLAHAELVVEELRQLGIGDEAMHLVASDHSMLQKAHLHEATEMETTEVENDFNWGIVAGGVLGLVAGIVAYGSKISSFEFGAMSLLVITIIFAFWGGVVGKAIGESTPNSHLEKYRHAIEAGQILMIVDVAVELLPDVYKKVRMHCPKALIESSHVFHDHPLAA